MVDTFTIVRTPELHFRPGSLQMIPQVLERLGLKRAFLVTGSGSVRKLPQWKKLVETLDAEGGYAGDARMPGEPSPGEVDEIAELCRMRVAEVVIGIGGGSAIDAAKATAAAVMHEGSIRDYLEGVGAKKPTGKRLPLIACPTTAGTGTEATKNASLRELGPNGFKKSLRHDGFVPDIALIDPELATGVPRRVTAASGLDAITQNMEAYISTKATPFTDALAVSGLEAAGRGFLRALDDGSNVAARAEMAWCAHTSGISLANAGLGLVHGVAGPAGAMHDIPHGVACGLLLPHVTRATIARLEEEGDGDSVLARYARAGVALSGEDRGSVKQNCDLLLATLERLAEAAELPGLGAYDFTRAELKPLAEASGMKQQPVAFEPAEVEEILAAAM
jgi:alcohol dehydrogenase class IV